MLAVLAGGCTGELFVGDAGATGGDAGAPPPTVDAGVRPLDAAPGTDAGPPAPVTDAGPPTGSDAGPPTGACVGVTCGAGERCEPRSGACVCADGFMDVGGRCAPVAPGDPSTRTADEVCTAWRDGHVIDAPMAYTPDGMCGLGTVTPGVHEDVVRRASLFRWLAGLGPVTENVADRTAMQECAVMMSAAGALDHMPEPDWPCYTADGARAARFSNLSLRFGGHPAEAIDQLMRDCSRPPCSTGIGHRKWQLYYGLGSIGIGAAQVEGASFLGTCIGIANGGGTSFRPWVAYPNPGPAPLETTDRLWSFHPGESGFSVSGGEASVVRVSDGASMPVTSTATGSFGLPPGAVVWSLDGWTAEAGETYRVTIAGLRDGDVTYDVEVVDCR